MNDRNKRNLSGQLYQMADGFQNQKDSGMLMQTVLSGCAVMLDTMVPELQGVTDQDCQKLYATCLGLGVAAEAVCRKVNDRAGARDGDAMQTICKQLTQTQQHMTQQNRELEMRKKELSDLQQQEEDTTARLTQTQQQVDTLKAGLSQKQNRLTQLEQEEAQARNRIQHLDDNIEALIKVIDTAKENYAEMVAQDEILADLEKGLEEEGYVDMDCLKKTLEEKNREAADLMDWYKEMIGTVLRDLEEQLEQIQKRNGRKK